MLVLMELEALPALWRSKTIPTWDIVLKTEGFCTANQYRMFKRAQSILKPGEIERLGLKASCRLASVPSTERPAVLRKVRGWYKDHETPPTHQRVTTYLHLILQEKGVITTRRTNWKQRALAAEKKAKTLRAQIRDSGATPEA